MFKKLVMIAKFFKYFLYKYLWRSLSKLTLHLGSQSWLLRITYWALIFHCWACLWIWLSFLNVDQVNSEMLRESLEKIVGTDDSTFSGFDLATLIRNKYGKSYDVQLIKKVSFFFFTSGIKLQTCPEFSTKL